MTQAVWKCMLQCVCDVLIELRTGFLVSSVWCVLKPLNTYVQMGPSLLTCAVKSKIIRSNN